MSKELLKAVINNEGYISLEIAPDELFSIIKLLQFSKDLFINVASDALTKNDSTTFDAYASKAKEAENFHSKFGVLAQIGEPERREIH